MQPAISISPTARKATVNPARSSGTGPLGQRLGTRPSVGSRPSSSHAPAAASAPGKLEDAYIGNLKQQISCLELEVKYLKERPSDEQAGNVAASQTYNGNGHQQQQQQQQQPAQSQASPSYSTMSMLQSSTGMQLARPHGELLKRVDELEGQVANFRSKYAEAQKEHANEVNELKRRLAAMDGSGSQSKDHLAAEIQGELDIRSKEIQKEMNAMRESHAQEVVQLQKSLERATAECRTHEVELLGALRDKDGMIREHLNLKESLRNTQQDLAMIQKQYEEARSLLSHEQEKRRDLEERERHACAVAASAENDIEQRLTARVKELQASNQTLSSDLQKKTTELESCEANCGMLKSQLEKTAANRAALHGEHETLQRSFADMEMTLKRTSAHLADVEAEREYYRLTADRLKVEASVMEVKVQQLESRVTGDKAALVALERQYCVALENAETMKRDMRNKEQTYSKLDTQDLEIRQANRLLTEQLKSADKTIADLRQTIADNMAASEVAKSQLQKMKTDQQLVTTLSKLDRTRNEMQGLLAAQMRLSQDISAAMYDLPENQSMRQTPRRDTAMDVSAVTVDQSNVKPAAPPQRLQEAHQQMQQVMQTQHETASNLRSEIEKLQGRIKEQEGRLQDSVSVAPNTLMTPTMESANNTLNQAPVQPAPPTPPVPPLQVPQVTAVPQTATPPPQTAPPPAAPVPVPQPPARPPAPSHSDPQPVASPSYPSMPPAEPRRKDTDTEFVPPNTIWFYRHNEKYGCFANFYPSSVRMGNTEWPTSEHFFQAAKFEGDVRTRYEILMSAGPREAAAIGRDRSRPLRKDWENVKDQIMHDVVLAKFQQHKDIQEVLLSTGDQVIVEHTDRDSYWGDGGDGSGKNMLGKILMQVRDEIRSAAPFQAPNMSFDRAQEDNSPAYVSAAAIASVPKPDAVPPMPPAEEPAVEAPQPPPNTVWFYGSTGRYGCFANFYPSSVRIGNTEWPTSEHYFQAAKFEGSVRDRYDILTAKTPKDAAAIGRDRTRPLRKDWENVKDQIMHDVVLAKFQQHKDIQETLLATGNMELVERTPKDSYWGDGGDGSGKNMLGKILMQVRDEIRSAAPFQAPNKSFDRVESFPAQVSSAAVTPTAVTPTGPGPEYGEIRIKQDAASTQPAKPDAQQLVPKVEAAAPQPATPAPAEPQPPSDTVWFYGSEGPHGCFANFYPSSVRMGNTEWPTSEHYFQAAKFEGSVRDRYDILTAKTPKDAAAIGRDRSRPLRKDWENVKDKIMHDVVLAKFQQHKDIQDILLATGNKTLVERTPKDSYWGDGGDGSGKNMLGKILMQVRDEIRSAAPFQAQTVKSSLDLRTSPRKIAAGSRPAAETTPEIPAAPVTPASPPDRSVVIEVKDTPPNTPPPAKKPERSAYEAPQLRDEKKDAPAPVAAAAPAPAAAAAPARTTPPPPTTPPGEAPLSPANTIVFLGKDDPQYAVFSNSFNRPVRMGNTEYATAEHFFQAAKYENCIRDWCEVVLAKSPEEAIKIGADPKRTGRSDWDQAKDKLMYDVVLAKFQQHQDLCAVLMSTGDLSIVFKNEDKYWGNGGDSAAGGENRFGKTLCQVRDALRRQAPEREV